jgi:hypothetical protein
MLEEGAKTILVCFEEEISETTATTPKTVLGLIPGECGFCSSETKYGRRTAPEQKLFVLGRRLQEQGSQSRENSWVRVPVKLFFVLWELLIEDDT